MGSPTPNQNSTEPYCTVQYSTLDPWFPSEKEREREEKFNLSFVATALRDVAHSQDQLPRSLARSPSRRSYLLK